MSKIRKLFNGYNLEFSNKWLIGNFIFIIKINIQYFFSYKKTGQILGRDLKHLEYFCFKFRLK